VVNNKNKTAAVVVAHPDDETLWAGGTILMNPSWKWFIATLSRASDHDRSCKFQQVLQILRADGIMGDMDDGPQQTPLNQMDVRNTILKLLPKKHYDLIITHSPKGEYTRHLRHEEVARAVITLWHDGKLSADELWLFAYTDNNAKTTPMPIEQANVYYKLPQNIWQEKYRIITKIYGFAEKGFEAQAATNVESFWRFTHKDAAWAWLEKNGGIGK